MRPLTGCRVRMCQILVVGPPPEPQVADAHAGVQPPEPARDGRERRVPEAAVTPQDVAHLPVAAPGQWGAASLPAGPVVPPGARGRRHTCPQVDLVVATLPGVEVRGHQTAGTVAALVDHRGTEGAPVLPGDRNLQPQRRQQLLCRVHVHPAATRLDVRDGRLRHPRPAGELALTHVGVPACRRAQRTIRGSEARVSILRAHHTARRGREGEGPVLWTAATIHLPCGLLGPPPPQRGGDPVRLGWGKGRVSAGAGAPAPARTPAPGARRRRRPARRAAPAGSSPPRRAGARTAHR